MQRQANKSKYFILKKDKDEFQSISKNYKMNKKIEFNDLLNSWDSKSTNNLPNKLELNIPRLKIAWCRKLYHGSPSTPTKFYTGNYSFYKIYIFFSLGYSGIIQVVYLCTLDSEKFTPCKRIQNTLPLTTQDKLLLTNQTENTSFNKPTPFIK